MDILNRNISIYQHLIRSVFADGLEASPSISHDAVVAEDTTITYPDFCRYTATLGEYITRKCSATSSQPIIAILLPKSHYQIIAVWGIIAAGAAYLPLDIEQPIERIKSILEDAKPSLLIVCETTESLIKDIHIDTFNIEKDLHALPKSLSFIAKLPGLKSSPTDLCYIIYTSGTTGKPKGVMVENCGVINAIEYTVDSIINPNTQRIKVLGVSALHHDMSVFDTIGTILTGGTIVLPTENNRKNPEEWSRLIHMYKVNTWVSVPAIAEMLLTWGEFKQYQFSSLETAMIGGDWIPLSLYDRLSKITNNNVIIYSVGGPTETTMWNISYRMSKGREDGWNSVPYGFPIKNCSYSILDKDLNPVPIGTVGELFCGGISLARGYLNDKTKTEEKFVIHPKTGERLYATGDLGKYHENGCIEFIGRKDGQLKVRGNRIESGEVRATLEKWPGVLKSVVYLYENNLAAILLLDANYRKFSQEELYNRAKQELAPAMIPSIWVQCYELPLTQNAKVDIPAIIAYTDAYLGKEVSAPTNSESHVKGVERKLKQLWEETLNTQINDVQSNFYSLGGNSLSLIRLLQKIHNEFQIKLQLPSLLKNPLLSNQIELIQQNLTVVERENQDGSYEILSPVPLSAVQKGMWLESQNDNTRYTLPFIFNIAGQLDIPKFREALNTIITANPIFTSSIKEYKNEISFIPDTHKIDLEFIDASILTKDQQSNIYREQTNSFINISETPLIAFSLVKLADTQYQFFIKSHHIVLDGLSCHLLLEQLIRIYEGDSFTRTPDFLAYLRLSKQKSDGKQQQNLQYWEERLATYQPMELPFIDKTIPHQAIKNNVFTLEETLVKKLKNLAKENGTTLFSIFSLALHMVLSLLKREGDVIFGTYTASRINSDYVKTLGNFVSPIPIKIATDLKLSLVENLINVQTSISKDMEWQEVELARILRTLQDHGTVLSIQQIMPVMLVFNEHIIQHKYSTKDFELTFEGDSNLHNRSQLTDIELWIYPSGNTLCCDISYWGERVQDYFINVLKDTLLLIIENFIAYATSNPLKVFYTPKDLLTYSVLQGKSYQIDDKPITQIIYENSIKRGDKVIFIDEKNSYDYNYLYKTSTVVATHLQRDYSLVEGSTVGICIDHSIELITIILGVLKAGGVILLIDPDEPEERIQQFLKIGLSSMLVTHSSTEYNHIRIIQPDKLFQSIDIDSADSYLTSKETDKTYMCFTSGSTGKPKAIEGGRYGLLNRIYWGETQLYQQQENERLILKTSVSFVDFYAELFSPMILGLSAYLLKREKRKNPFELAEVIINNKITQATFTPTVINALCDALEERKEQVQSIHTLVSSGEMLSWTLCKKIKKYFPNANIVNIYGSSEMSADVSAYRVSSDLEIVEGLSFVPIGKPLPNIFCKVCNNQGIVLPLGFAGELHFGGKCIASKYFSEESQQDVFYKENQMQWFKTGDFGFINKDCPSHPLILLGRKDDQVKIRGVRINLKDIEYAILQCHGVMNTYVTTIKTDSMENAILGALVELSVGATETDIYEELKKKLPFTHLPNRILSVVQIPVMKGGKVDKIKAKDYFMSGDFKGNELIPLAESKPYPFGELELIWQNLLNINYPVKLDDNFFLMGGDSILATKLINHIKEYFEVSVNLVDLFENARFQEMGDLILNSKNAVGKLLIQPQKRQGSYPLSQNQQGLWFLGKINQNHLISQNIVMMYDVIGEVNPTQLQYALNKVIERHEAFRTKFFTEDGQARKLVQAYSLVHLEYEISKNIEKTSSEIFEQFLNQKFNFEKPPFIRVCLIQSAEELFAKFVICIPHLIFDGWSLDIFMRDLSAYYQNKNIPMLVVQGIDYDAYQFSNTVDSDIEFWKEYLDGKIDEPQYPIKQSRQFNNFVLESITIWRELPTDFGMKVKNFTLAHNIGEYTLFLCAFLISVAIWSKQRTVVVGGTISGRNHKEIENVIDFFSDILPFKGSFDESLSIKDNFLKIIPNVTSALKHSNVSFNAIVEHAKVKRSATYHPLVQIICTYQNILQDISFGDCLFRIDKKIPKLKQFTRFDMELQIFNQQGNFRLAIDYAKDLYDESNVSGLLQIYEQILVSLLNNYSIDLNKLVSQNLSDISSDFSTREPIESPNTVVNREMTNAHRKLSQYEIHQVLLQGLREILKRQEISPEYSIFEQGGTSMDILSLQIYIQKHIGLEVDIAFLLGYPTVYSLGEFIFNNMNS